MKPGLLTLLLLTASYAVSAQSITPAAPQLAAEGYLLIDADTGHVLVEYNSVQRLPPASLTKIMTSYIISAELRQGTVTLEEEVDISVKAWRTQGSRMFVREGTKVSVNDLKRGIIIQSGNDASVAMAERIAGSEDAFADLMNQHAARLGLTDTNFMNATGLPDENHYTTAADLAKLTNALIRDFPEDYKIYSEKYFTYNDIRQPNRNTLLWRDKTVDGVKTGHTEAAGYCLVASAKRDGMRLISVVMGASSEESRAIESQKLLTYGFRYFETVRLYDAGETLKTVRVWGGKTPSVDLGVADDIVITVPQGSRKNLDASMDLQKIIRAPLQTGDTFGTLKIMNGGELVKEVPLVANTDVAEGGFFKRLWHSISLFFSKLFSGDTLAV
ncbi:MAG: D-alanyl-D-alanine carboxypeptidase (penicillin-binding protein 5/6) [Candidatus Azotimanducaceae bacterium]|jgi:D-alanyl-D-alanine carboxypeptidase (penicillin-binding protein 5/6)